MGDAELFEAYLDESEDSSSGLYVVGGFMGKADVWRELEPKWLACLPAGVSFFHASDCVTGNEEFEGMAEASRVALLDRLMDLLVARELWLVSYAIDGPAYKEFARRPKRNEFLGNRYAAPLGGVVGQVCEAMGNTPQPDDWEVLTVGDDWEQCAFFIESSAYDASASDTIAGMRIDRQLWYRNRIGREKFGSKSGRGAIPLLQVADLGAYLAAKHRSNAREGRVSWKTYYDKLRDARRVCPTVLADAASLRKFYEMNEQIKKERAEKLLRPDNRS